MTTIIGDITMSLDAFVTGPGADVEHGLGLDAEGLRLLLRDIYTAAGGEHPDFAEYDREMVADRRAAVLITPTRIHGNPT